MQSADAGGNGLMRYSEEVAALIEASSRWLVRVDARRRISGSGVLWEPSGLVVTADHVLERDEDISVTLGDGREFSATVAGRDPSSDMALLRVDDLESTAAPRGPAPRVGHVVFALGAALGSVAATGGMVTSIGGRSGSWRGGRSEEILRTDAVLYPGFSGGPLIDAAGRLIGINTSFLSPGASTAVALSAVERVTAALARDGRVLRPYLGVVSQPAAIPSRLRQASGLQQDAGLLLFAVEPGTPADRSGLLLGDVLVMLDGAPLRHAEDLQRALGRRQPGENVSVGLIRGGERMDVAVTLGERNRT